MCLASLYNAVFQANHILEPAYTRDWSHGLRGLQNFTIILAFDDATLKPMEKHLGHDYFVSGSECYTFGEIALGPDSRSSCSFVYDYMYLRQNTSGVLPFEERENLVKTVGRQIRLVPMDQLKQVIRSRLTAAKTAFVSPLKHFDSDWEIFREEMRAKKALKFSRYFDEDDSSLGTILAYGFTRGLHPWHQKSVPRRLKTIVSNGLFGIWKKWENIRQKLRKRKGSRATSGQSFLSLSLHGTDIYAVFVLFCLCTVGSFGVFFVETCVLRKCQIKVSTSLLAAIFALQCPRKNIQSS